jgi:sarcosine oxidase subunit delta
MLLIHCPYCGTRAETEFTCGGEGGIVRPVAPDLIDDEAWGDYLFFRRNPKGQHHEQWCHSMGCGRWFNASRDSVSYRFLAT